MASLNRGETRILVLRASYHGVETAPPSGVATWSVSDSTVGTVTPITEDGLKAKFFALSGGTCEVTAILGSLVAKQSVEVRGEADALEILIEGETAPSLPTTSAVILLEPISRLFPADNWWNVDISAAPVDPRSTTIIAFLGGSATQVRGDCGLPYFTVQNVPLVPVRFTVPNESDSSYQGETGYPIPDIAKSDVRYIEGDRPGGDVSAGDSHLLIVDKGRNRLYELYGATWTSAGWTAEMGAIWDLSQNGRRPDGWASTDAAGLAVLPGVMRADEVYGSSPIQHAHRFTAPRTDGTYVWPASHQVLPTATGAGPLGMRLRLKATVDTSTLPAPARKLADAMKRFGLIFADRGQSMFVSGTKDPAWKDDVLSGIRQLHASDFEVIQLGWRP